MANEDETTQDAIDTRVLWHHLETIKCWFWAMPPAPAGGNRWSWHLRQLTVGPDLSSLTWARPCLEKPSGCPGQWLHPPHEPSGGGHWLLLHGLPQLLEGCGQHQHPHPIPSLDHPDVHQLQGLLLCSLSGHHRPPGQFPRLMESVHYAPGIPDLIIGDVIVRDPAYLTPPALADEACGGQLDCQKEHFIDFLSSCCMMVVCAFGHLQGRLVGSQHMP